MKWRFFFFFTRKNVKCKSDERNEGINKEGMRGKVKMCSQVFKQKEEGGGELRREEGGKNPRRNGSLSSNSRVCESSPAAAAAL